MGSTRIHRMVGLQKILVITCRNNYIHVDPYRNTMSVHAAQKAEKYLEKNYNFYFIILALTTWLITVFIGILLAKISPQEYRNTILSLSIDTATVLSWLVPLNSNWYWRITLQETTKKMEEKGQ